MNTKAPRQSITLPPEQDWRDYLQETTRRFATQLGFSDTLAEMVATSVVETCMSVIRCSQQAGLEHPLTLEMEQNAQVMVVRLRYHQSVPLDLAPAASPPQDQNQELLDAAHFLAKLLAREMDKVFYRVENDQRIIEMHKYPRSKGKESRYWVMDLVPALRKDLRVDFLPGHDPELPAGAVVTDPRTGRSIRFDEAGAFLLQRMDGKTKCYDVYLDYVDRVGPISPRRLGMIYEALESRGMLAGSEPEESQQPTWRRWLRILVGLNYAFRNADAIVTRVYRRLGWTVGTLGLVVMFALGISGLITTLDNWPQFIHYLRGMSLHFFHNPWHWLLLYGVVVLSSVLHEFGHALVCKRFGGRVNSMGIMFYVAFIIYYCDVSSAWLFLRRRHRVLVCLGGPFVTFAILGVQLWIVELVSWQSQVWLSFWIYAAILNLAALVMNFNPFLRMDSYYMLMEGLGIPNLRERSFAYLKERLLGWLPVLRRQAPPETSQQVGLKERLCFWLYGLSGALVTAAFFVLPIIHFTFMLRAKHGWLEIMVSVGLTMFMLTIQAARYFWLKYRTVKQRTFRLA